MCDLDAAATLSKGFPMSKGMVRAESCGFIADPRCTRGETVKTVKFDISFKEVDTQKVCSDSTPAQQLVTVLANSLSIAESDISVKLCQSGFANMNNLTTEVTITESGGTDLGMVKSMKKDL